MSDQTTNKPIRLAVDEAKERYDTGQATILDVVDPGPYEELDRQIEDAVRIDPREIEDEFDRLPQERTILTYCT